MSAAPERAVLTCTACEWAFRVGGALVWCNACHRLVPEEVVSRPDEPAPATTGEEPTTEEDA